MRRHAASLLGLALGGQGDDSLAEILGPQGAQELERLRYADLAARLGPQKGSW